ncbi:SAM-dependent methyltransferase [Nitrospira moscoviensis]|uniref:Methyltransferase type 11 domain-containing protein n=1 Tax=Nitrospira moscoviensis TaxID=42253 RepID=A0A0K2GG07_NITMO|nr:hypothetical protein [Nitrospira moscoviensis]ALA59888.1 hypothetical protein NITMOv2_3496 [Nitrospira moscoviensis]
MKSDLRELYQEGGLAGFTKKLLNVGQRMLANSLTNIYFYITPSGTFQFSTHHLKYFRHTYNLAYQNERTVEIPIAEWFLRAQKCDARILEVGNVLRNYGFSQRRDILDKYDAAPGLINMDVVDFLPEQKYDAIISISTLEHVGWDEPEHDPGKIPAAIKNLRDKCLSPGGTMLVTLPLGYNPFFDEYLERGGTLFSECYYLKRVSVDNRWEQTEYSKVSGAKFGEPYNNANAMFIGIVRPW